MGGCWVTYCVGVQRSWALKGVASTAGMARSLMRELLCDPMHAEWLDDAQLAMTEIVTNAVLHTRTDLVLTIRVEHGRLCVQLRDDSPKLPVERRSRPEATTGRGIALVRALTSAYGAEPLPEGGKIVWFVMGPPEDAGSDWPVLDGPSCRGLTAHHGQQQDAVQVFWQGVPLPLWMSGVQQSADIMRELALYQAEQPTGGITRAELAAAALARAQVLRAVEALPQNAVTANGLTDLRIWVTPQQAVNFASLAVLYEKSDRLAQSCRLLTAAALPEMAALRRWACAQVPRQLAGELAQPWTQEGQLAEPWSTGGSTVQGWDKATVARSARHVMAADGTNRIVAVSASLAALLGWQVDELVGRRLVTVMPARFRSTYVAGFNRFLTTGERRVLGQTLELPLLCADGREVPCRITLEQVGTRVGHPVFTAQVHPVEPAAVGAPGQGSPPGLGSPTGPGGPASADLGRFALGDLSRMASTLRNLGEGTGNLQAFADRVCRYLYDHLLDEAGQRQTLLVRFYATLAYDELPVTDRDGAGPAPQPQPEPDATCITLLATVGDQPAWNDRLASRGAQTQLLTDAAQIHGLPTLNAIVEQLGIEASALLVRRNRLRNAKDDKHYGVFHVADRTEDAADPAHGFYEHYGVRSQLGFGGMLPNGGVFGILVFSRVCLPEESAHKWETLAHSIALGAFARGGVPVFAGGPRTDRLSTSLSACQRTATQNDILTTLLVANERVAADESDDALQLLERANFETQRYAALAQTLQASLLPPELPTVAHLELGAAYRPAGDGAEIGGDFYDLFPTLDGRYGFVLGDVSGKGAQAAALTSLARHTVRAAAAYALGTGEVLAVLDRAVASDDVDGRYLTALFAFLTPAPGQLSVDLALGGHPQPLVVRADGSIEAVGIGGSAIGLVPDPDFTNLALVLRSGDTLVAYSDGVTEARRGAEEFGEQRLRVLLGEARHLAAAELALRIRTEVLLFQLGRPRDDLAVVVLRCP